MDTDQIQRGRAVERHGIERRKLGGIELAGLARLLFDHRLLAALQSASDRLEVFRHPQHFVGRKKIRNQDTAVTPPGVHMLAREPLVHGPGHAWADALAAHGPGRVTIRSRETARGGWLPV